MPTDATALLQGYNRASLDIMMRFRNPRFKGNKQALVAALAPTLFDLKMIKEALEHLTTAERELLDIVVAAGGSTSSVAARAQLTTRGTIEPPRTSQSLYSRPPTGSALVRVSRSFEDLVARLGALCLVFSTPPQSYGSQVVNLGVPGSQLYIPEEILAHLPKVSIEPEVVDQPAQVRLADPTLLLRDTYLLMSFAERDPIPLTKRGQIMKRSLVAIDQTLRVSEDASHVRTEDELGRLPFLRAISESVGLLAEHVGGLYVGDRAAEVLSLPQGERLRQFFEWYLDTHRWSELFRIPDLTISNKAAIFTLRLAPEPIITARKRLVDVLRELPADRWVSFAHLLERVQRRAYEFLFPRSNRGQYYSSSYGYGYGYGDVATPYIGNNELGWTFPDIGTDIEGWSTVEGGMIRVVVEEALHWLGVVDLGYENDKLVAFRVTENGQRLMTGSVPQIDDPPANVVVQPNFQVFAFEPVREAVLFFLDRIAERRRVDQATEYELTRDSISQGMQLGLTLADILATLEHLSRVELPQNVRRTLEEWGASHERITIRRGSALLQTVDEATLDALYADERVSAVLGRRLGPTVAITSHANLRDLHDRLLSLERIPATSEGDDADATKQLTLDDDGHIDFVQALPSVFVTGAVRRFADDGSDGALRLTRESLRRGAKLGLEADEVLRRLDQASIGDVPADVQAFVRRWAKNWGSGSLQDVTLLQVESADVLQDLLADPELRPDLTPLPGSAVHAIVRQAAVKRVHERLTGRGMALSDSLNSRQ